MSTAGSGLLLLGVNGAPALGFPNGKRLVRWLGFRHFLDDPDPRDPQGRTFRYLLATGHYPEAEARDMRAKGDARTKRQVHQGVTGREIRWMDEFHTDTSRTYRWTAENDYVEEMDARDAEKMLAHPALGQEFAYADVESPILLPRRPDRVVLKQWAAERVYEVPRGTVAPKRR